MRKLKDNITVSIVIENEIESVTKSLTLINLLAN